MKESCAHSASELQTEESVSAAVEKPALSKNTENLMERIVDRANLETAWRNIKANRGAGTDREVGRGPMVSPWMNSPIPSGTIGRRFGGNSWKGLINRARPGASPFPSRMAAREISEFQT